MHLSGFVLLTDTLFPLQYEKLPYEDFFATIEKVAGCKNQS